MHVFACVCQYTGTFNVLNAFFKLCVSVILQRLLQLSALPRGPDNWLTTVAPFILKHTTNILVSTEL